MSPEHQTTEEEGTYCPECGGPLWLLAGVPRCGQCYEPTEADIAKEWELRNAES